MAVADPIRRGPLNAPPPAAPDRLERAELGSGLRVVVEAVPGMRSIAAGVWVTVGARDEPASHAGVSHFLEHLLFKGTDTRTARQISEEIDGVGGDMNAFTTRESTAFYVRVPAAHAEAAIDLLCDIVTRPALRERDVESERQVIIEELLLRDDTPDDLVHDILGEELFPGHPLGTDILGTRETIEAVGRDDIAHFFEAHYGAPTFVVAAAGAVDPAWFTAAVAERLGERSADVPARVPPPVAGPSTRVVHRATEQVNLAFGVRALPAAHPDRYALAVVNHVLGGGMSSRLFEEVREQRGLVYSVYSYVSGYDDAGMLGIYAGTAPKRAAETVRVVADEVARLCDDGITERELSLALGYVEGALALGLEQTSNRMSRIAQTELTHGEVWDVQEQLDRYRAVTLDDAARVAADVLSTPMSLAVVGPVDEEEVARWA